MTLLAFKNTHLKFPELSVDPSFIHKLQNTCIFSGNVFFIADVRRFSSFLAKVAYQIHFKRCGEHAPFCIFECDIFRKSLW